MTTKIKTVNDWLIFYIYHCFNHFRNIEFILYDYTLFYFKIQLASLLRPHRRWNRFNLLPTPLVHMNIFLNINPTKLERKRKFHEKISGFISKYDAYISQVWIPFIAQYTPWDDWFKYWDDWPTSPAHFKITIKSKLK